MSPKNSLSEFSRDLWLTLGTFVVAAITFGFYAYLEKQVDHANELRLQSYLLADELRHSSDDLTRMVRTYVATGDPLSKKHYQEILDIRDGKKPRPVAANDIYWDLVLADDQRTGPGKQAIPLLELMRQVGFTESEFAGLAKAKANSDVLTRTEFAAMALIESTEPTTDANRLLATRMLYDESYHQAKYGIMHPISEFQQQMDQRTLGAVRAAENSAALVRAVLIAFCLLLAYTLYRAYWALRATLGCSVDELQGSIVRLGNGDFSTNIPVAEGMENSVLGWLSATQLNLAQLDVERKQAEESILKLNEELESKVLERTQQLLAAQEELVRKEKLSILGQLSGSVGHELRNPLGVMSNAVYFLKMVLSDADETTREYLDIIKKEIDNSLRIITDLLDFARTRTPQFKAVTARELTEQSIGQCAFTEDIVLRMDIPDELPLLRVDPLQMGQVLTNFITNAVQAMPEGGALRIAARLAGAGIAPAEPGCLEGAPPQVFVEISVTDTGTGISPENRGKLFQPLFTTKAKGIGLGLVVCKNLVAANGGRIEVESEPGQETTFTVSLPAIGI